jgi:TonB dependent receptor/Carboxypeptidase regulatory-like domain
MPSYLRGRARTRVVPLFAILISIFIGQTLPVLAQTTTFISGTVVADGKAVKGAPVTLTGGGVTLETKTDTRGAFSFNALTTGTYTVSTPGSGGPVRMEINLPPSGATITLNMTALREISHIVVPHTPVSRSSGTDYNVTGQQITRAAYPLSLPQILLQAPAAARGSNGQVHINGDHNGIAYQIDGVQVPEGLNRVLGSEIDPAIIGSANLIEGAFPAQYGDKFAGVFDISTKSKTGPAGASFESSGGSYNAYDNILGLHAPVGAGGSVYVGARLATDGWALDPAVPDPVHNAGSISSQFARLSVPLHGQDTLTFDLTNSLQTFQIAPDTSAGTPASTDDNERQEDTFSSLIYRHAFANGSVLAVGPSYKRGRIVDSNDPENDLIGQIVGPQAGPCSTFLDCSFFSVFADRTDINSRLNADYAVRTGNHELRFGGLYGAETVQKNYVMTVPATNGTGSLLTPFTVVDNAPNVGHTAEFYAQDGWQWDPHWRLDYGVRSDYFSLFSNDFQDGFAQVSPRVKLTHIFTSRANVYAYYGRLFVPFSLESVSPVAAAELNAGPGVPIPPGTTNDLRPQRDSLYEIGGHIGLGPGSLGIRISHKVSTDWIDDTQVGSTNLHQDINFPRGLVDSQSLYYDLLLARGSRFTASLSHVVAQNSLNCETQLLQNCAASGPPGGDLGQADHDQHYDATAGLLLNDRHSGWFSLNGEYGSGLSRGDTTLCPPFPYGDAVNCKVPPHLTFDVAKGFAIGNPRVQVALAIQNLFNDRYAITVNSSLQGTHYARPRTFVLRVYLGGN